MSSPDDAAPPRPAPGPEDAELLRRYAAEGSEAAFAELVRRRIGLVYSVALRHTHGDRHRAADATQSVFTDLARKAPALARRSVLAGWLYRSAQYAATGLIRAEQRRHARELRAHTVMDDPAASLSNAADWEKLRPVLDEALNEIDERDRDAILLRFFDGRPFAEIGAQLRLTENAARMRVERALDKLHAALARRGITSTAAALGLALGPPIGIAAPAGLAASITGAALTHAATNAGAAAILLGLTKLQLGAAATLAVAGSAAFLAETNHHAALHREIAATRPPAATLATLRADNQRLAQLAAEIESLRRDGPALAQLEQRIAEARRALAARTTESDAARLERVRQADRAVQAEVDRLNLEGNALVKEFKRLETRAGDASLSSAQREDARTASKQKLVEIQAKQREIKALIENARHVLKSQLPSSQYRPLAATSAYSARDPRPSQSESIPGKISLARPPSPDARVSLRLPNADLHTALSAYERYAGRKILRDVALAQHRGTLNLDLEMLTPADALRALDTALRDQLHIVVESASDGALIARPSPVR